MALLKSLAAVVVCALSVFNGCEAAETSNPARFEHSRNSNGSVNYDRSIHYSFDRESFLVAEWQAYAPVYADRFDLDFHFPPPSLDDCRAAFLVNEPFIVEETATTVRRCLMDMRQWMHLEMVRGQRDGPLLSLFFEELIPFLVDAPQRRWTTSFSSDVSWAGLYRDKSLETVWAFYGLYSDWYGTSEELDASVLSTFNAHETLSAVPISADYFHCPPDIRIAPAYDGYITDSCGNYGAEKGLSLALLGLTLHADDLVNEAITVLEHTASHTTPEGGTVDAFRSGAAPGYLMQGQTSLDPLAFLLTHFTNVDAYGLGGGLHNNTVSDVIRYSIETVFDPSINWHYAKANDVRERECCHQEELWKRDFDPGNAEVDTFRQLAGWIQAMAGFTHGNPQLRPYFDATREQHVYPVVVYWNGPIMINVTEFSLSSFDDPPTSGEGKNCTEAG